MQYVRDTYGAPVWRGQRVRQIGTGIEAVVTRCTNYVHCRGGLRFHPGDLEYELGSGSWVRAPYLWRSTR